jgi:hypothetical protein
LRQNQINGTNSPKGVEKVIVLFRAESGPPG